jgi:hypothetical protein
VTNDGNVTIRGITVKDDLAGIEISEGEGYTLNADGTVGIDSLAPNASVTITAVYTVTGDDILAGSVENHAAATGTDPDGKPRYDLTDGKDAGYAHSPVIPALSASYRGIWYSDKPWEVYSAIGLGLIFMPDGDPGWLLPLPAVTPFGVRVGGEHFYGFLESSFSPAATFIHGGVGWHF